jgi:hypothetical protein
VKFKFIASEDNTHTTKEFETDYFYEVIPQFEEFLRGCGFVFDGHLDTIEDVKSVPPVFVDDVDMDGRC